MNKQNAMNALKFLDRVEVKGHQEREVMNAVCAELLGMVNTEELDIKEPDGEADTE